jgi:hypothetical protein
MARVANYAALQPRPFYLSPSRQGNGRWSYPFALLLVGEQMRCPVEPDESPRQAAQRSLTAGKCWTNERGYPARRSIRFRSRQFARFILMERVK